MAKYKQDNYGWGLTLDLTGKIPAINKRIFNTYNEALAYVNNLNDSAIEGLILSVCADSNEKNNGAYFVEKVATSGSLGKIIKIGTDNGSGGGGLTDFTVEESLGENNGNYLNNISKKGNKVTATYTNFDDVLNDASINAPKTKVVKKALDAVDGQINSITNNISKLDGKIISVGDKPEGHVKVSTLDNVVTITETDIASEEALNKLTNVVNGKADKNVTYSNTNYLDGQTSLYAADVKLDAVLKQLSDTCSGGGDKPTLTTKVKLKDKEQHLELSAQTVGDVTTYELSSKDIASNTDVNNKINKINGSLGNKITIADVTNEITKLSGTTNAVANQYITGITQENGTIKSIASVPFEDIVNNSSNNAPKTKAVYSIVNDNVKEINKKLVSVTPKPNGHVIVSVTDNGADGVNGKNISITETDIASEEALNKETKARRDITGIAGDTTDNVKTKYNGNTLLSGSTTLAEADIKLSTQVISNSSNIQKILDGLASGGGGQIVIPSTTVQSGDDNIVVNELPSTLKSSTNKTYSISLSDNGSIIGNLKNQYTELNSKFDGYLPLTGGTIDGNLIVQTGSNTVTITNGTIDAKGAIYSSDRNLKKDIALINNDAIESVKNIDLKSYKFKDDETNRERYGVIAQELEEANLNNLVVEDSNGKKGVDYVSFLILKIAQLEQEIKQLKNR